MFILFQPSLSLFLSLPFSFLIAGARPFSLGENSLFGPGNGFIILDEVNCNGNESRLFNCRASERGEHNCGAFEDSAVFCPCKYGMLHNFDCNRAVISLSDPVD